MDDTQDTDKRIRYLELQVQVLTQQVQELMNIKALEEASQAISSVFDKKQDELIARLILLEQKLAGEH